MYAWLTPAILRAMVGAPEPEEVCGIIRRSLEADPNPEAPSYDQLMTDTIGSVQELYRRFGGTGRDRVHSMEHGWTLFKQRCRAKGDDAKLLVFVAAEVEWKKRPEYRHVMQDGVCVHCSCVNMPGGRSDPCDKAPIAGAREDACRS